MTATTAATSARSTVMATDLSDRHVRLCAQDAIMAVQNRVLGLQMIDRMTAQHEILLPPPLDGSPTSSESALATPPNPAPHLDECAADAPGPSTPSGAMPPAHCILDTWTQRAFYDILHGPLTSLQHQTALRRHNACSRCTLLDVLRVSDIGQRLFLMVLLRWRGPFARVCHEWSDISRLCWQADEFEMVKVLQQVQLRKLSGPVMQLSSWVRASQTKPIFFLLALSEDGRLEQMRISCKKAEPGVRRPDADDDVRVEHAKDWRLEEAVPTARLDGVSAQFVVTKHHAYCVVAVRGQALLVKLGGPTNGTHEHMYTDRFPSKVTTMSMCPLDNNIIAFGVPSSTDPAATNPPSPVRLDAPFTTTRPKHVIELVNFAQSSRIQTLMTDHEQPMIFLDYSPDSEQLISCSADAVQLWYKEGLEGSSYPESSRGPGAMDDKPEHTLPMPKGTSLRIAKVHPAWTSVLLATNEALEVRELRRQDQVSEAPQLASRDREDQPLALKWRRQNMQVTAAAFISHGNMLVVSDRGDRLLLLNYHGLHAAKRCVLPWADPYASVTCMWADPHASVPPVQMDVESAADSSRLDDDHIVGWGSTRGVCTVTSIVECPDVARTEEWRSGVSQLAVSSSRGDVVLIKI
uniref:Uncharacterized protein n=1 Tax=Haptolina brevifila TaxID=156173 RepID=A0A7S2I0K6_9EUKA